MCFGAEIIKKFYSLGGLKFINKLQDMKLNNNKE
jgi:hypothetical protein